ncbi:low-density lipoprotein receptor-related protein 11 isoform X1 [Pelobates fuscus]|uniref:low-density lipoprotein receptor-related protein 11 isoform X1 n=1 Tax=Pelobates fuscus TaxID=191477 RepID=UPI002FE4517D
MHFPFTSWGNRPLVPLTILLTLSLCCAIGNFRKISVGSPAPQLTDLRSQISGVEELLEEFGKQLQQERHSHSQGVLGPEEHRLHQHADQEEGDWAREHTNKGAMQTLGKDATEEETMQQQLQEVGVRSQGNVGEDVCNFSKLEDYIIRTKDSLEAGATFLKAPEKVYSWKQCLEVCCSDPSCSAAVVERSGRWLSCFLFDCTHRGRNVCKFSPHMDYISYTMSGRNASLVGSLGSPLLTLAAQSDIDKPPYSNAGQDVILQLPVDWVILDGRESTDDHAIIQYDWTLLRGDPLVDMKIPQPGTLKLSHLQEGVYTLQLTVIDTSGQKSSDNVSVSVLPAEHHGSTCNGVCTRYQFICDDGCCIDITLACDRIVQCPDGSDEAFCQNFSSGRKTVIHISDDGNHQVDLGLHNPDNDLTDENSRLSGEKTLLALDANKNKSLTQEINDNNMIIPGTILQTTTLDPKEHLNSVTEAKNNFFISENIGSGHPLPESGAVLPLALGLTITALLLLMVICRLQLVRQKLKKARPLTLEESDYLINGMYL